MYEVPGLVGRASFLGQGAPPEPQFLSVIARAWSRKMGTGFPWDHAQAI